MLVKRRDGGLCLALPWSTVYGGMIEDVSPTLRRFPLGTPATSSKRYGEVAGGAGAEKEVGMDRTVSRSPAGLSAGDGQPSGLIPIFGPCRPCRPCRPLCPWLKAAYGLGSRTMRKPVSSFRWSGFVGDWKIELQRTE